MHRTNDMALSIVVDGQEQKIIQGNVYIPFHTEYALRLRNDNSKRVQFRINVDGKSLNETFIIQPYQTWDIERFMAGDLNSGPKFKFVPANHPEVDDPTSGQNGLIDIRFWIEDVSSVTYDRPSYRPPCPWPSPYYPPYHPYDWPSPENWHNDSQPYYLYANSNGYSSCEASYLATGVRGSSLKSSMIASAPEAGATIGGSRSDQSFAFTEDFTTEGTEHRLYLRLKPAAPRLIKSGYCTECGTIRKSKRHNFCSHCGRKFN